ncbi:hypothetical protein BDSB_01480 [Burkholderia dolosa PC543]|nr:hypothetical protein BDSB_01480 [Burkholderia dolosa PC543]
MKVFLMRQSGGASRIIFASDCLTGQLAFKCCELFLDL